MTELRTIGYEGRSLERFLDRLGAASVTLLVDVRELPLSRRRGFSKRGLASALEQAGIGYRHLRALGAPRPLRRAYRDSGDFETFAAAYRAHLAGQWEALAEVAAEAACGGVALLCFEADAERCHRSLIASALCRDAELRVRHL